MGQYLGVSEKWKKARNFLMVYFGFDGEDDGEPSISTSEKNDAADPLYTVIGQIMLDFASATLVARFAFFLVWGV